MKKTKSKIRDLVTAGKRKTAVAKATIKAGEGMIRINKKPISHFNYFQQLYLNEPLEISKSILNDSLKTVDITVNVHGGGQEGQVEAARLAIARAIVAYFKSQPLKKALLSYDRALIVADTRRKEQRKPNDSRARAARQKSYR